MAERGMAAILAGWNSGPKPLDFEKSEARARTATQMIKKGKPFKKKKKGPAFTKPHKQKKRRDERQQPIEMPTDPLFQEFRDIVG